MATHDGASDIVFKVPIITQLTSLTCWLAAAEMVLAYRSLALVIGAKYRKETFLKYIHNTPLDWDAIEAFAAEVGLNTLSRQAWIGSGTRSDYHRALLLHGPLWVAGSFIRNTLAGHAVVVVGVKGDQLIINDPNPLAPCTQTISIKAFNQRVSLRSPLLCNPPHRSKGASAQAAG